MLNKMFTRKNLNKFKISNALVLSDAHLETGINIQDCITPAKNYPVIVPGDLTRVELTDVYKNAVKWLSENFHSVIIVPGNHEYICRNKIMNMNQIDDIFDSMEQEYENVIILRNEYAVISGVVVYGGVLWSCATDIGFKKQHIYKDDNQITLDDWNNMYFDHIKTIDNAISYSKKRYLNCVVITHFAPVYKDTIDPKYDGCVHNCLYASNLSNMVANKTVKTWIYGHTGYNNSYGKLLTNQFNKSGYKKDYILL